MKISKYSLYSKKYSFLLFEKSKKGKAPLISKRDKQCVSGVPEGARTPDLLLRRQPLYPTELPRRIHFY